VGEIALAGAALPELERTTRPHLPRPRGPITEALFRLLRGAPGDGQLDLRAVEDPLGDDDLQLALYCSYELHYRGFQEVDDELEWAPEHLALRGPLERLLEARLRQLTSTDGSEPSVARSLAELAADGSGPSLSRWLLEHGTLEHARELARHRSAYQLKEADPHTWGIPRLEGRAKAAFVEIQTDEYGNGYEPDMHASLFAGTLAALGLRPDYGAYLEWLPGSTLLTCNLISMFGLHRRLRGALVGHLALFEMTSVVPMGRYSEWFERLGLPDAARQFYDVHVEADELHQQVASGDLVGGLLEAEPWLASDVLFGARALALVEAAMSRQLLRSWQDGTSSLLAGCPG